MAEEAGQEKSIPPSERRRQEAREQGQFAVSAELSAGLLLLAAIGALWLGGKFLAGGMLEIVRTALLRLHQDDFGPERAESLLAAAGMQGVELVGIFLGFMLVFTLAVGVLQVGFHFTPALLTFKWEKLSPANGWSRMLSMPAAMRGLLSVLKVVVVGLLAWWAVKGRMGQITTAGEGTLLAAGLIGWDLAMRLALAIAGAMLVLGLADYGYQWWRHEQSLYMTPQEYKEELKREDGDPHVKARIRKLQRDAARKRMWEAVPKATVVITNPTHLAIALLYDRHTMEAPRVVAKGAGHVAERVVQMARRHAVPVVERKPLAQALYKAARVGHDIPLALYHAVAEVIAHVYRLKGN